MLLLFYYGSMDNHFEQHWISCFVCSQEEMKSDMEEKLRDDNSKVAESLENMMALHTELQCKYESLQIELGKKDTQLNQHKKDK